MTVKDKTKIINAVKALLYARRSGSIQREQTAHTKLVDICQSLNFEVESAIVQVTEHLKKTSIAASMNGIV